MEQVTYHQATCTFALVRPQDLMLQRSNVLRTPPALLKHAGPWVFALAGLTPLDARLTPHQPVLVSDPDQDAWRLGRAAVVGGMPLVAGRLLLLSGGDRVDLRRELPSAGLAPDLAERPMAQTALGLRADGRTVLLAAPSQKLADVPAVLERLGCLHGMSLGCGSDALALRRPGPHSVPEVLAGDGAMPVEALLLTDLLELVPPDARPCLNVPGEPAAQLEPYLAWRGIVTLTRSAAAYTLPSFHAPVVRHYPGGAYFPVFRADPLLQWFEAVLYDGSTGWLHAADLQQTPAPDRAPARPQDFVIVIDPGHGGTEMGALGPTGLMEKDVNLDWALRVRDLLGQFYNHIWMTRTTDEERALRYRSALGTASGGNLFISLHNNAGVRGLGGTETYYQFGVEQSPEVRADSRRLASLLQTEVLAAIAAYRRENAAACAPCDRGAIARLLAPGDPRDYYHLLRETRVPTCVVEAMFLTNPAEEACLRTSSMRQALAQAVVRGTQRFLQGQMASSCNLRGPYYGL